MRFWTILDGAGTPIAQQVASEVEPDPAIYGGASAVELGAQIDPATAGGWDGSNWAVDLTAAKAAATARVNDEAEVCRNLFITPGAGQALTYQRKEAEARAWSVGADPSDFPFLSAEADATGMALADLVDLVIAQADAWVAIGSAIEGLRRGAVVAIEAATTAAEIAAARAVDWESLT